MIKQVYLVRYAEMFGYADTLEEAERMERQFELSYGSECFAATTKQNEYEEICADNCADARTTRDRH